MKEERSPMWEETDGEENGVVLMCRGGYSIEEDGNDDAVCRNNYNINKSS